MKVGQVVECTIGVMKGEKFIIVAVLKNGWFSCRHVNGENKYYEYADRHLKLV